MRRGVVAMAVAWAVVLGAARVGLARGEHEINDDQLEVEMARNRALAAYVARNGKPDLAESRELADRPPWDDHEVTLYYLGIRKEIGFARAWILGQPTVHLERYERPLSDADVAALWKRARHRPASKDVDPAPGSPPAAAGAAEHAEGAAPRAEAAAGPAERAEQAAQRAEAAASRLEAAAAEAEHAADRAEAASDAMETAVQTARRK
ncbi:MAG: hypothetical protein E6J69_11360 [Deltaproteobacteria bacterium]|nr:MAG: hypothetical protein E6J69_11360 [Deltaproteobacteria bacterium]